MAVEVAALDLWTIFVNYTFGSFLMAVVGLALVMFIIMGILGKMSIYSVTWYLVMFGTAMGLGYGYATFNILITLSLVIAFIFSWKSYIDSR